MFRRRSPSSEVPLCPHPRVAVYRVLTVARPRLSASHSHVSHLLLTTALWGRYFSPCSYMWTLEPRDVRKVAYGHMVSAKPERVLSLSWPWGWVLRTSMLYRLLCIFCQMLVYFTDFLTRLWATSGQNWILSLDTWSLGQCLTQNWHPRNIGGKRWKEGRREEELIVIIYHVYSGLFCIWTNLYIYLMWKHYSTYTIS